ncbi:putative dihydroxyacetone kinase regulator [Alkalibaculum bacchi]|uniref:Putative dihydroxyacetone kinase regulator n=1 Tax=Alkalibaculum bacchi TaxID=645887 RepID=A0A366HW91_9FIRM|nr:TetR/AcrR family transcriptional regulator C-terminal domain-containing protein [Alkalibaculum bacchi]RBP57461.1 putative dihydroxyacetone kinase regulator [Alkalibaculum bacchi]
MIKRTNTQDLIVDSFRELLTINSFKSISVQDICDNCSISRMTFYRHYHDKYELMNWIYISEMEDIIQNRTFSNWDLVLDTMLDIILRNSEYFSKVVSIDGQNSFEDFLFRYGYEYALDSIKMNNDGQTSFILDMAVQCYCYGTTSMIINWIKDGYKISQDDMKEALKSCIPIALTGYIS